MLCNPYNLQVLIPERSAFPCSLAAAVRIATEERPGAVHIELPEDIASEDAKHLVPIEPIMKRRPVAEDKGTCMAQ